MYQTGQLVVYGIHGVCRVVDQEERNAAGKQVNYLVLEPLGLENTRFLIPTQNPSAMSKIRRIISGEELEAILASEEV